LYWGKAYTGGVLGGQRAKISSLEKKCSKYHSMGLSKESARGRTPFRKRGRDWITGKREMRKKGKGKREMWARKSSLPQEKFSKIKKK